tara:strand:+ start:165 stop:329 length:165 start_codon:yes stop_codon:yes gene_type:complete
MLKENGRERMRAWKELPEPKPPWEMFKRMLLVFDDDAEKARQAWIKNQERRPNA